ncbi:MAG: methyltransferase [Armatimonadota bacterium]|nr:class I SAM-dependent methyltransferase [Armatimonadota bacterium]MCX7777119.1 class I SAM-dependent methyltransferase [Armatimonadota bacterium]MDW8025166.1 methyltransferase [Armatimonadota bacterium]
MVSNADWHNKRSRGGRAHNGSEFSHYFVERPQVEHRPKVICARLRGRMFSFHTDKGVFAKDYIDLGTKRLIEMVELPEEGDILDLGCGYGVIGIVAAACNPKVRVWMVDINERAVALAKKNAKACGLKNVHILHGDGFEPLPEELKFDAILSNPPMRAGMRVVMGMLRGSHERLKPNGTLWIVVKTSQGAKRLQRILQDMFGNAETVDRHGGYRVIKATKRS